MTALKTVDMALASKVGVGVKRLEDVVVSKQGAIWMSDQNSACARAMPDGGLLRCGKTGGAPNGMLTGKYRRGEKPSQSTRLGEGSPMAGLSGMELTEHNFGQVEKLESFGKERDLSLLQIAVGWLLAQPGVTSCMAGATKPDQVKQNAAAAGAKLSAEDISVLNKLTKPAGGLPF